VPHDLCNKQQVWWNSSRGDFKFREFHNLSKTKLCTDIFVVLMWYITHFHVWMPLRFKSGSVANIEAFWQVVKVGIKLSLYTPWRRIRGGEVKFHSVLTSTLLRRVVKFKSRPWPLFPPLDLGHFWEHKCIASIANQTPYLLKVRRLLSYIAVFKCSSFRERENTEGYNVCFGSNCNILH